MELYPLKFDPIYKEKIWGGRNLERLYGRQLPENALIGESWDLADLTEGVSVVRNGSMKGMTLNSSHPTSVQVRPMSAWRTSR